MSLCVQLRTLETRVSQCFSLALPVPSRALYLIRPLVHTKVPSSSLLVSLQSISLFLLLQCSELTHPLISHSSLSLAPFTFLEGRLESSCWLAWCQGYRLAVGGCQSKGKLPSLGPSPWASGRLCHPAASAVSPRALSGGRAEPHVLGSLLPFGSQRQSSNWGTVRFLCVPVAGWKDRWRF